MQYKESKFIDKSNWKNGEWDYEPDKIQFVDQATGYPCLVLRGPVSSLCGYVGVYPSHPFFNKDCSELDINVHGGLTYSDKSGLKSMKDGIWVELEEGDEKNIWWFGFDCGHIGDIQPKFLFSNLFVHDISSKYRNVEYVKSEVISLAGQLKTFEKKRPKASKF